MPIGLDLAGGDVVATPLDAPSAGQVSPSSAGLQQVLSGVGADLTGAALASITPAQSRIGQYPLGFLLGHRGVAAHAPENTLASLRKAAEMGMRGVEFDVRLSRDGHPVLFHDERLSRTTGGRGCVFDRDLADLKKLDAGAGFGFAFRGERIPTLAEAVALLETLGIEANVEIKAERDRETETAHVVIQTLKTLWPESLPPPIVSSFNRVALAVVAAEAPEWERALVVKRITRDWRRHLDAVGATAIHCKARWLSRRRADEVLAAGVPLRCFTVNTAGMARKLFAWGVNALFTDAPDRLSRFSWWWR